MGYQAVIFDLDGTLLDTLEDIADSANSFLRDRHLQTHHLDAYRSFIGNGVGMLIKRALPANRRDEKTIAAGISHFRRQYSRNWNAKTKPYNGIPELLNRLSEKNMKLAVLSNKPDEFTKKCVDTFLPAASFAIVMGQHSDMPLKPNSAGAVYISGQLGVSAEQVLYVGDSSVDMETATSAGMFPVGALWGFRSLGELINSGAKAVVRHPMEIVSLLDRQLR